MQIATMFAKRADTGEIVAAHVMIPAEHEVRDEEHFDGNNFESETMSETETNTEHNTVQNTAHNTVQNTIDEMDVDVVGEPATFAEDDGESGTYKGDYITQLWNQLQTRISD